MEAFLIQYNPSGSGDQCGHTFISLRRSMNIFEDLKYKAFRALQQCNDPNNTRPIPKSAKLSHLNVHWKPRAEDWKSGTLKFPQQTRLTEDNSDAVFLYMLQNKEHAFIEVVISGDSDDSGGKR